MSIDTPTTITNITELTAAPSLVSTAREPLPLVDPAKAAKLRAIIQARADTEREAARLRAENEQLRTAPVPADDPRMRHIWVAAALVAEQEEYCGQYDAIIDTVGGPSRQDLRDAGDLDRSFRVRTHITLEVWLEINAYSEDDAIRRVDSLYLADVREHLESHSLDDADLESWDAREAEADD
ncbi:hypothetical protein AB2L57_01720 [Microbacterium sp. HA-8]|uniref:hypothetical protein n=1 Tax=unclassified Microbacterium TaxID=2609290 RepID=UPI000C2B9CFD|nr:hypothetical protein [Microbacterium sp. BR1]